MDTRLQAIFPDERRQIMRLLRLVLACSLLLLAASPSFALGCFTCNPDQVNVCDSTPDSGTRCRFHIDYCETITAPFCTGRSAESQTAVLADWTVASIEISRPAYGTKVVTAPAAVASVRTPQPDARR
jgi:hypothetical protein